MVDYFAFYKLNKAISTYMSADDRSIIAQAFLFGADAHETQKRSSGEPYFNHPVAVATILAGMKLDAETIIAALLHDVIEDTDKTTADIQEKFGEKVAHLVNGVTKLTQIKFDNKAEQQSENFLKMILAMFEDIRVILVKLADRLHNMSTLSPLRRDKKHRISTETLEIYAPIAHKLGMNNFKNIFEDLAFEGMYPYRHAILKEQVRHAEKNRQRFFHKFLDKLVIQLKDVVKPENIIGRKKRLYSIYRKMRDKSMSFSEIMDIYAYKIIASNRRECYLIMGIIHESFRPMPGKFKDYISTPKANGYQSLHTIVFGPYGVPIEIQIKTKFMDEVAETGIASHWIYKLNNKNKHKPQKWVEKLSNFQTETDTSTDFIEGVKMDLFSDEVYVFSIDGEIIELPRNATCVDFAYHIHSEIGNHCVGAKVNRRSTPLSYKLNYGDTVEIITSNIANPNERWLKFVTTKKASHAINIAIKKQRENHNFEAGKAIINKKLSPYAISIDDISSKIITDSLERYTNIKTLDAFLIEVGLNKINIDPFIEKINETFKYNENNTHTDTSIKIIDGSDKRISTCCYPLDGDKTIAVIIPEKGLQLHRAECIKAKLLLKKNDIKINAEIDNSNNTKFKSKISISIFNKKGAIADLTAEMSRRDIDILSFNVREVEDDYGLIDIIIYVKNVEEITKIINAIKRMSICIDISRKIKT